MKRAEVETSKESEIVASSLKLETLPQASEPVESLFSRTTSRQSSAPKLGHKASILQFPRTRASRGPSKPKTQESVNRFNRVLKLLKCLDESKNSCEPVWITPHVAINSDFWAASHNILSTEAIRQRTEALNQLCDHFAGSDTSTGTSWSILTQRVVLAFRNPLSQRRVNSLSIGGIKETLRSYSDRQTSRYSTSSNLSSRTHSSQPSTCSSVHSDHPELRSHKNDKPLPLPPSPLSATPPSVKTLEDQRDMELARLRIENIVTGLNTNAVQAEKETPWSTAPPSISGETTIKEYANSLSRLWNATQLDHPAVSQIGDLLNDIGNQIVSDILFILRSNMSNAVDRIKRSSR